MKKNKTALIAAVDYLAKRSHTEKEIRVKLTRKGYPPEEIEAAAETLKRRGYLDDEAFCLSCVERYVGENKHSMAYIRCKLAQKGFSGDLIDACMRGPHEEREAAAAANLVRMKRAVSKNADPLALMKYLYGKGFQRDAIRKAVEDYPMDDM